MQNQETGTKLKKHTTRYGIFIEPWFIDRGKFIWEVSLYDYKEQEYLIHKIAETIDDALKYTNEYLQEIF